MFAYLPRKHADSHKAGISDPPGFSLELLARRNGGNFGVWGGLFSTFDCAVKGMWDRQIQHCVDRLCRGVGHQVRSILSAPADLRHLSGLSYTALDTISSICVF